MTNLAWLLSQASYVLATQMTAALEKVGISPRSYCVLSTAMTGEFTQIDLAHAVGLDKTTMVVTIDELEAAGLAKRRQASDDRRARIIAVTKAGERKVAQAEAADAASRGCARGAPGSRAKDLRWRADPPSGRPTRQREPVRQAGQAASAAITGAPPSQRVL